MRQQNAKRSKAYKRQQSCKLQVQALTAQQYQGFSPQNISEDDIKRVTDDRIKSHFTDLQNEAQEKSNVEAANRIVRMFGEKIVAGKDKYDDFETVAKSVRMENYPGVVQLLAEHVDNSADVLYHLAKNRSKLYEFERFYAEQPEDAVYEMKRLSDSMKANEEASKAKNPNAPLSQNRPSNTGTDSGGALSMSDLKRKYRA